MERVSCRFRLVVVLRGNLEIAHFRDFKSAYEFANLLDDKKVLNWHIRDLDFGFIVKSKYEK